jgi:hypothetical protein
MTTVVTAELKLLFEADQRERKNPPPPDTPEYAALRERDAARRARVRELAAAGALERAEDCYYAALVLHHGGEAAEVEQAHRLALTAMEQEYRPARWLAAATLDRWLMMQGRPQKFGTQIVPDGRCFRVGEVDPATTDAERAAWDVRPLARQIARAAELNRIEPMPDMTAAPAWLKAAIARWGAG